MVYGMSGCANDLDDLAIDEGFTINGISDGDFAGISVSGAGDVNGDGIGDIIIGTNRGTDAPGEAYVVFGAEGRTREDLDLSSLDGTNGLTIKGTSDGDALGYDVSGAGDVNGDGFDDVIVGAPGQTLGNNDPDDAYVVFGRDFNGIVDQLGTAGDDDLVGGDGDEILIGAQGNDSISGNGGDDVLKGAAGDDTLEGGEGGDTLIGGSGNDVFVFENLSPQQDWIVDFVPGDDIVELRGFGLSFDGLDTNDDGLLTAADTGVSGSPALGGTLTIMADGFFSMLTFQNVSSLNSSDMMFT